MLEPLFSCKWQQTHCIDAFLGAPIPPPCLSCFLYTREFTFEHLYDRARLNVLVYQHADPQRPSKMQEQLPRGWYSPSAMDDGTDMLHLHAVQLVNNWELILHEDVETT